MWGFGLCTLHLFSPEKNSGGIWIKILDKSKDTSFHVEFWEVCPGPVCGSQQTGKGRTVCLNEEGVKELACLSSPSLYPSVHGAQTNLKIGLPVLEKP